ncbi:MAG: hypothetical protein U0792_00190 [Gemmataceae bacterium]
MRSTSKCNSWVTGTAVFVHFFERDCSIQRRHQKVVELAPAPNLPADVRQGILDAALAVGRACGIDNASTVEFLYDTGAKRFYFIEVNPRIQVEHTVTEQITGFDIVRSQIMIAAGHKLDDEAVGLRQSEITARGFAIQCRVTTEDPANGFVPDYGRPARIRPAVVPVFASTRARPSAVPSSHLITTRCP